MLQDTPKRLAPAAALGRYIPIARSLTPSGVLKSGKGLIYFGAIAATNCGAPTLVADIR